MKLTYHQATYDLLTQKPIDTQREIERYTQYFDMFIGSEKTDERRQHFEKRRTDALAWTRLDLYQHPAQFSEKNIQQLDTLETQYQVKLPAAVREWYSLDITPEIMSARLPEFGFVRINNFMPFSHMKERLLSLKETRDDLWFFLVSEYIDQGGEEIAFKIDAGDDPPVFAESGGKIIELAPTFSEFIYFYFWDWYSGYTFTYSFSIMSHPAMGSMQLPAEFRIPIQRLRERFTELTNLRGIRFYDEHTRIWPRLAGTWENDQAVYDMDFASGGTFRTDSLAALEALIIWLWGENAPVFRMNAYDDDESHALIDSLQHEQMRRVMRDAKDWTKASDLARQLGTAIPMLSTTMMEKLKALIAAGEAEAHPDNREDTKSENRYRAK